MTAYMIKPDRRRGEAVKKPGFFKRLIKAVLPWKGDNVPTVIRKLVFVAALIVFLITAIPLLLDVYTMMKDEWITKSRMEGLYIPGDNDQLNEKGILPSFESLLEINPDTVGYLKIEGTAIDYPVVKGTDNDYYLKHDFWNNESRSGCIMMDYKNTVSPSGNSGNLVLYGHNMAVGTFFAGLSEYWRTLYDSYDGASIQMYKDHPTITFNTLYEEAEWKIFAIGLFNIYDTYGEVFDYNNKQDFTSREDFNNFIINIMDRSDIFTDVDIQYGDDILTLSTCYWPFRSDMDNVRLAIFARKVRPGESEYVNTDVAQVNTYVKRWQWVYDNIGGGYDWFQSNWDRRKLLSYTAEDAEKDGYTFLTD